MLCRSFELIQKTLNDQSGAEIDSHGMENDTRGIIGAMLACLTVYLIFCLKIEFVSFTSSFPIFRCEVFYQNAIKT